MENIKFKLGENERSIILDSFPFIANKSDKIIGLVVDTGEEYEIILKPPKED